MKSTLLQAAVILGVALIFALLSVFFHPGAPAWYASEIVDPMALQPEELKKQLGDSIDTVLWVDARKSEKFAEGHMPGAILLNKEDWETLIAKHIEIIGTARGRPIVVYCDGNRCMRSSEIAERLRQAVGLKPVYILKGDWRKWGE